MTHSSVHDRLAQFSGRRVAVIGGGQSALQTGALLQEAGAEAQVIARTKQIIWEEQVPEKLGPIGYLRTPPSKLCEGWGCVAADSPDVFRLLPESVRVRKALTSFGPKGAWWLRDRVEGVVEVLTGHQIKSAEPQGDGVLLHLDGAKESSVTADHVIAGNRLPHGHIAAAVHDGGDSRGPHDARQPPPGEPGG